MLNQNYKIFPLQIFKLRQKRIKVEVNPFTSIVCLFVNQFIYFWRQYPYRWLLKNRTVCISDFINYTNLFCCVLCWWCAQARDPDLFCCLGWISHNKIWNGKYSSKVSKIENHITLISFCLSLAGRWKCSKSLLPFIL